jgi:hypothetical protein
MSNHPDPSRIHAAEEQNRKILRQDLQDEQDKALDAKHSPNNEGLFVTPHPLFHPVNPVNPVKIQFIEGIVPQEHFDAIFIVCSRVFIIRVGSAES